MCVIYLLYAVYETNSTNISPSFLLLYIFWCFVPQSDSEVTRRATVWDYLKVTIKETHKLVAFKRINL